MTAASAAAAATITTAKDAKLLGEQLQHDPVCNANHAFTLLQCLQQPLQEPIARAAIQALKLFYIEQHDEGQLQGSSSSSAKRFKVDQAAASSSQEQQQQQTPEQLYAAWLARQYAAYITALLQLLGGVAASASLQVAALSALMECVRHEAGPAAFSNRLFTRVISLMLTSGNVQPEVFSLLFTKYLHCLDVRFYTLAAVTRLAQQHAVRGQAAAASASAAAAAAGADSTEDDETAAGASSMSSEDVSRALFDVLSHIAPIVPPKQVQDKEKDTQQQQPPQLDLQSWCGAAEAGLVKAAADSTASAKARRKRKQQQVEESSAPAAATAAWANLKLQQRCYGDAWLAFLRTDLPHDTYRKVLLKLHSDVLPAMVNPLLLSDFLSHSLDRGGLEGMLALNGIFRLVTRHGLEYPAFYARLYGLITPAAFVHKQRVQFFQLADIFLSSGMVPAYTAAAFAKKFGRLALRAPPAGAMLALGFIHNIIRRHPACMLLLHKPATAAANGDADSADSAGSAGADVFDEAQPDPAKSRAVESSLWELAALRNHYCPQVAAMSSVLDKDLSDRVRSSELDLAPLLPASYASLMAQELGRKLRKGVSVAFYARAPQGLWDAGLLGEEMHGWDMTAGMERAAQP